MIKNLEKMTSLLLATLEVGKSAKQMSIYNLYESAEQMWTDFDSQKPQLIKMVGESGYSRIKYSLNQEYLNKIIDDLDKNNVIPVTYFDKEYPELLKNIYDPPLALFCKGEISLLKSNCVAIVGTRKASVYGRKVTETFTKELCKCFTVVSGLAYGIDTVAHETTVASGGKTIAVLGSGVNNIYPATNKGLAEKIIATGGLIMSEHSAYEEPTAYNFPMRNRIIAGISSAVLVTESPEKSGTLSTVEYALENGADIYVVPGDIFNQNYIGSNRIIKNMQGCLVTSPFDILSDEKFVKIKKNNKIQLDLYEQMVVDLLCVNPLHFDELVKQSGISASQLNYTLSTLELKGIIARLPGNTYQYIQLEET